MKNSKKMATRQTLSDNKFVNALIDASNIGPGPKGHPEYKSTKCARLDVFNRLNQNSTYEEVGTAISEMIREVNFLRTTGKDEESQEAMYDIFRLWAFKRGCHKNGEGNKKMSYYYLLHLAQRFPDIVRTILENGIFAEYGVWKDVRQILNTIHEMSYTNAQKYQMFHHSVVLPLRTSIMNERINDLQELDKWTQREFSKKLCNTGPEEIRQRIYDLYTQNEKSLLPILSNAGKFTTTEKGADNKNCYWFLKLNNGKLKKVSQVNFLVRYFLKSKDEQGNVTEYSPSFNIPWKVFKEYRQNNSRLRAALSILESDMSTQRWDKIRMESVPSRSKMLHLRALLNEDLKDTPSEEPEISTGNRFPKDKKRILCRQNTRQYFRDQGKFMSTNGVFPHEIAYKAYKTNRITELEACDAMWEAKVREYKKRIQDIIEKQTEQSDEVDELCKAIQSGRFLPVADVSGSMTCGKEGNQPMDIATGMAAFMSEISAYPYNHLAMTFTDRPSIYHMVHKDGTPFSLKEKMIKIRSHVGYNTNFIKMNETLASLCHNKYVPKDQLPVVVLYSDEGWDIQTGMNPNDYKTIHEKIIEIWRAHGYERIPLYVYWNLSNKTKSGFQATADFPGVMMLQGSSPNLFNLILYGENSGTEEKEMIIDGKKTTIEVNKITPYQTFRNAMDQQEFFAPLMNILEKYNL